MNEMRKDLMMILVSAAAVAWLFLGLCGVKWCRIGRSEQAASANVQTLPEEVRYPGAGWFVI